MSMDRRGEAEQHLTRGGGAGYSSAMRSGGWVGEEAGGVGLEDGRGGGGPVDVVIRAGRGGKKGTGALLAAGGGGRRFGRRWWRGCPVHHPPRLFVLLSEFRPP